MFYEKKKFVIWAILVAASAILLLLFFKKDSPLNSPQTGQNQKSEDSQQATPGASIKTEDEVLKNALNLYLRKKEAGLDMTNGPCIGTIAQDWVLDIAHDPREPVDDLPQNQCEDFRAGRAHHFVELDENGELIKID